MILLLRVKAELCHSVLDTSLLNVLSLFVVTRVMNDRISASVNKRESISIHWVLTASFFFFLLFSLSLFFFFFFTTVLVCFCQ